MTPRLWSVLTTVAVVVSGAAASPAAAAPPPVPAAPLTSTVATAPPVEGPQTTVTGELRRIVLGEVDGTRTAISAVVTADGDAVHVQSADVADVAVGSTVTVTVAATAVSSHALALDGGAAVSDVEVLDVPAAEGRVAEIPAGPAPRDVHLMSALLPGQTPAAIDLAPVVAAVANASDYFSTSTGGAISLAVVSQRDAGTFTGWGDPATCEFEQVFGLLDWAAEQAGIFPAYGSGKHAVVQTPSFPGCDGLGMIMDTDDGGAVWVNGATGAGELDPWVVAQALGHTLGLGSSHARMDCEGLVDGSSTDCDSAYLGSAYDVMGLVLPQTGDHLGTPGPLNAAQLEVLGLLDSTNAIWAIGPGTNTLKPVGGLTGVRFLRIAGVSDATYYVELRAAVGPDADLGTTRLGCVGGILDCTPAVFQPGVIIHRVDGDAGTIGTETFLVEAAAQNPRYDNSPPPFVLAPGRSIVVEDGEFEIGVAATSPTGTATVTVKKGPGAAVHKPFGNFESATAVPGSVRVRGWAMDRDTRLSSYLWVSVGSKGQVVRANAARADLTRFYPEQGAFHGIDVTLPGTAGQNTVCVTVINTGPGANTSLGCRTVTVQSGSPIGNFEVARGTIDHIEVSGWALDPDTAASSYVWVEAFDVTGRSVSQLVRATGDRPDIGRAFPGYGNAHGFSASLYPGEGTHRVCATAVNHAAGTNTPLGCRTVQVLGVHPVGNLDDIVWSPGFLTIVGWTMDPETTASIQVRLVVNRTTTYTVLANLPRADVGAIHPGYGVHHGFALKIPIPPGRGTQVCARGLNVGSGMDWDIGCLYKRT